MKQKMYVLVRKDLDTSYQAVQGGHALAEFLIKNPDTQTEWSNGTLIYLGVKNEEELERWIYKINKKNINYAKFREPDIGDQITSIALYYDGKLFSKLKLL